MVLPKKDIIPDIVTSGLPTVAVRMSAHPIMQEICEAFGKPIAAPSANRFGRISPTSAGAVLKELDGRIPLIVDGGACNAGLESTIVRVEVGEKKPQLHLLRAGPVVKEDLQKFGKVIRPKKLTERARKALLEKTGENDVQTMEAPGMLESHYAPSTPLYLFDKPEDFIPEEGKRYALLSYRGQAKDGYMEIYDWDVVEELSPGKGKLGEASVRLFHLLRSLDESGVDAIVAEPVAETGLGVAINDRLRRASQR
jgi:L-threonylcarbamoyladenylate synthase